jgi:aspartate carbamoyltransferase
LLDLYTIREELGHLDDLTVTLQGDLKNRRTVHSLARLLCLYNVSLNFVAPDQLRIPAELIDEINEHGLPLMQSNTLEEVLPQTDVLYVTRVQKERFDDQALYEQVKNAYVITPDTLKMAKDQMIVMHPLPRVGKISMDVDSDPRAAYFRQVEYGMCVRMALRMMVLGKA